MQRIEGGTMANKSQPGRDVDIERRHMLKMAGLSAAVSGLGLGAAQAATTNAAPAVASDILDVAIIGAGFAGLVAARDLVRAGCTSLAVFEARDRVGGRAYNADVGNGFISEVGGQWIGPGQTAVANLARELDVGTFPTYYTGNTVAIGGDGRFEMDLGGTFGTDLTLGAKLSELSKNVPSGAPWTSPKVAELDALSVGDWLAKQDIKPEDQMGWTNSLTLTGGIPPAKMGLLHFLSMINSANRDYEQLDSIKDSAQGTRFVGGSQLLCTRLAKQLGDKMRLSTPIRRISGWDADLVTLYTDKGIVRARRIIMALSPPLCNRIEYEPALPDARAALHRAWPAHSPARKSAMVYSRPFWRDKGLNGSIFQYGGPIIWAFDNSPPGGEIGIINAFAMNAMLPSDPKAAEEILKQHYAAALGDEALSPISYHDHDWGRDDPWTITCISAIPPGFWSEHGKALRPPCGRLIWSGTETADIWAGYMDGAVRSGQQAALEALNALRGA